MKEFSKTLSFIKDHWWLFGLGGILYQGFFLTINNSINLFSWSQIPADTVLFIIFITIAFIFFLPWAKYEDIIFKKWYSNLFIRFIYAGLVFILIWYIYSLNFVDDAIVLAIKNLFILSVFLGLMNEFLGFLGKRNERIILFLILVIISLISIGNATYGSLSIKRENKIFGVSYMNDNYILLKDGEIIKNTDSIILTRNLNLEEK